jgi:hypothetical protein
MSLRNHAGSPLRPSPVATPENVKEREAPANLPAVPPGANFWSVLVSIFAGIFNWKSILAFYSMVAVIMAVTGLTHRSSGSSSFPSHQQTSIGLLAASNRMEVRGSARARITLAPEEPALVIKPGGSGCFRLNLAGNCPGDVQLAVAVVPRQSDISKLLVASVSPARPTQPAHGQGEKCCDVTLHASHGSGLFLVTVTASERGRVIGETTVTIAVQ